MTLHSLRARGWVLSFGVAALLQHCNQPSPMTSAPGQEPDGLEVIRWTTTRDTSALEGLVVGFQKRPVMDAAASEMLLKEGFLASIVDRSELPLLRERLGSDSMDIRTNYGTLPGWRDICNRPIPNGQAIVINGRPAATADTLLQMSARGWTTPTESGACLQLEIAASLVRVDEADEMRLARADRPLGRTVANTGIETCLQPEEVLIVLCANPGPFKSGRGPGSETGLPPTAGVFLLGESSDPQGRETTVKGVTLLAFVPHISSSIPPAQIHD